MTMPSKPLNTGASSTGSQAGQRYHDTFWDQHRSTRFPMGRPFWGSREFAANKGQPDGFHTEMVPGEYVASLVDPLSQKPVQTPEDRLASFASVWTAPWLPVQNGGRTSFLDFNYPQKRLRWRYDRIIVEYNQRQQEYYRAAAKLCAQNGWPEVVFGEIPRYGVTAIIGDVPPSQRIPVAAQAGDPWLLGFTDEINVELARLLNLNAQGVSFQTMTQPLSTVETVLNADQSTIKALMDRIAAMEAEREAEKAEKVKKSTRVAA